MSVIGRKLHVRLPRVLDHQQELWTDPRRFKCAVCGRRWGKTTIGLVCILEGHGPIIPLGTHPYLKRAQHVHAGALEGAKIWWVAPTYALADELWQSLIRATRGVWTSKNETDRRIRLPGGGSVQIKSGDDPEGLVSVGLDGVVLDEAGKFPNDKAWKESLRPTLMDREGWALFIGTPKGINWFHALFEAAKRDRKWMVIQRSTRDNPRIKPEEIEEMKKEGPGMGPLEIAQEIEAQFIRAGKGLFKPDWRRYWFTRKDDAGALLYVLQHKADEAAREYLVDTCWRFQTVDPAFTEKTSADYTCISTWAVTPHTDLLLVDVVRDHLEGPDVLPTMTAAWTRWNSSYMAVESTQAQKLIAQMGVRQGLPIKGINVDKDKIARALPATVRMEGGKIWFPKASPDWLYDVEDELLDFPEGEHDDFVDTLSLAVAEVARTAEGMGAVPLSVEQESPWAM